MLKKDITYTNFNDEEVTETFFFHLSKAELIELEMSKEGGLAETLRKIIDAGDNRALIEEFKKIIQMSYGKRSEDGSRFIKNKELWEDFVSSEAYSTLFWELATNTDFAVEFVNGIIPKGMQADVEKLQVQSENGSPEPEPERQHVVRTVTRAEMTEMSADEFNELGAKVAAGEVRVVDE